MMRKIDIPARHQNIVDQSMLEPVFCGRQRLFFGSGAFIWLAAVIHFWRWWLQPEHVGNWPLFISMSVILAWITLIPFYFIAIFFGARR